MTEPPTSEAISTQLQRIADRARQMPGVALRTLAPFLTVELLREATRRTPKDAAPGIDGQTWHDFVANLDENVQRLHDEAKSGRYRAPSVRRRHIPKGDGVSTRPLGIPTVSDKVLQRAVAMILGAVYEQEFLPCSYGFREGRSAHDCLSDLRECLRQMNGAWVLEVDIRKFFDNLDHGRLRNILGARIADGVLLRLIGKWLNAGVVEDGELSYPETGSPQGGVISPLLANVYLHTVLDLWFEKDVKPRLRGPAHLFRYADDFVIAFACFEDAQGVLSLLAKRFAKYGLELHPEKTRLVNFRRPPLSGGGKGLGTFPLLGFTHYWGRSRRGYWVIKRKTERSRLGRSIRAVWAWCRDHRHWKLREQHRILAAKIRGHCSYFGVTGNSTYVQAYGRAVVESWLHWLRRRSQRRPLSWDAFKARLAQHPLPVAIAVRSTYR